MVLTPLNFSSDPNTQAWLKTAIDPVFGFPKIVRFSWTTVKVILEKNARSVKWSVVVDADLTCLSNSVSSISRVDEGQASLIKAFEGGKGLDKDRSAVAKDLHISNVDLL